MTAAVVLRLLLACYAAVALFVFGLGIVGVLHAPSRIARLAVLALLWPELFRRMR